MSVLVFKLVSPCYNTICFYIISQYCYFCRSDQIRPEAVCEVEKSDSEAEKNLKILLLVCVNIYMEKKLTFQIIFFLC